MRHHQRAAGFVAGFAIVAGGAWLHAQQDAATFRSSVEYVEVDVIANNAQGEFVRDLTKDDFQITEDGKRQSIATFSLVDIPIEKTVRPLFTGQAIDPDVSTNEHPFEGRIYVMVMDDLHTRPTGVLRARSAARQFIEQRLGANDLMAVLHTAGSDNASQDFTSNRRLLLAAIDKTSPRGLDSSVSLQNDMAQLTSGAPAIGPAVLGSAATAQDSQRAGNAIGSLRTLRDVAEWFTKVKGRRKSILFVSEGIDYDTDNIMARADQPGSQASAIVSAMREAIDAAMRANVGIYGIDPRGVTGIDDIDVLYANGPGGSDIGQGALRKEIRLQTDSLIALSDETGGTAVVNRNNIATAFDQIVRDNSSYYVLAYAPPTDKRDGRFHKIDVRVSRPGVTTRARQGYVSPKGKPPAAPKLDPNGPARELSDALASPLPTSGLTMTASAAPFKGAAPNASVLVSAELRGRDLNLVPNDVVELSFVAVDVKGKAKDGTDNKITMSSLRPDTKSRIEASGFRVFNRIALPPGRYQMRIGARDTGAGSMGSVTYDLDIPDFYKLPFSMSGLVMTSLSNGGMVTAKADEELRGVLPAPPVLERQFAQNDELALFAEVYDNETAPHKVDIETRLTSDAGRVVYKSDEERSSSELAGARGGYGIQARVPLAEVEPGLYVLTVEAKSRLGRDVGASRQVQITVLPRSK